MVLDGIEYVLIPKDLFERSVGISSNLPTEEIVEPVKQPAPPVVETIQVVESLPDVKKAQGRIYGFADRLKKRALLPEDVMVVKTNFEDMPETQEIARNDFKDKNHPGLIKAKWGFYGPGAERDLG